VPLSFLPAPITIITGGAIAQDN